MENISLDNKRKLLDHLMQFVTDEKKVRFNDIIKYRTKHICVVLEDIFQPQNASAVLRTSDLTGIQDVHIIENKNIYNVNPEVALGSSKWLTLKHYNQEDSNTLPTLKSLKDKGYKIVATTPHNDSYNLDTLPLNNKIAVAFGTELTGLSDDIISQADYHLQIPMHGFTESYNISVSAALVMYTLTQRLRNSDINYKLNNEDRIDTLLEWAKNAVQRSEVIIRHFFKDNL